MKGRFFGLAAMAALAGVGVAQVAGGSAFYQGRGSGKDNAEQLERAKRSVAAEDKPPSATSVYLDASVLINVEADEYVAVFGTSREGATLEECRQKSDAALNTFREGLKSAGVTTKDVFIDFVAQNRIYGYDIQGDVAKERPVGFELKRNVLIHYRDKAMLDKLIDAAAQAQIYDLIKVDYVVRDIGAVQARLMEAAAKVVRQKAASRERLLGVKLKPGPQVQAEKYASYNPTEMYESYTAFEGENVDAPYRQGRTIQGARKTRTFYYNGLSGKVFDHVANPVMLEPMVQFTLYLKLKYEVALPTPPKSAASAKKKS